MTGLFIVSIVLFFPKYHIVGIIQYLAFSDSMLIFHKHFKWLKLLYWVDILLFLTIPICWVFELVLLSPLGITLPWTSIYMCVIKFCKDKIFSIFKLFPGTSLVVQWLRLQLPMQSVGSIPDWKAGILHALQPKKLVLNRYCNKSIKTLKIVHILKKFF